MPACEAIPTNGTPGVTSPSSSQGMGLAQTDPRREPRRSIAPDRSPSAEPHSTVKVFLARKPVSSYSFSRKMSGDSELTSPQRHMGRVRLGDSSYTIETQTLLDANGNEIFLRPKTLSVLDLLVGAQGKVVTRDTILTEVWPDVSVTDDSLTQCISEIRRAIGDADRAILRTLSKRGYQLTVAQTSSPRPKPETHIFGVADPAPTTGACMFVDASETDLLHHLHSLGLSPTQLKSKVPLASGTLMNFQRVEDALSCAFALERRTRWSMGIASGGTNASAQAHVLTQHSQPGEITVSIEIRDALISDPVVSFEDLGPIASDKRHDSTNANNSELRAFRATLSGISRPLKLISRNVLPTLAILPLREGPDGQSAGTVGSIFSAAVTQELSRSHEVNVISGLSTSALARPDLKLSDLRQLLSADFVLSGFWTRQGSEVFVTYEFADTRTHRALWSDMARVREADINSFFEGAHLVCSRIRKAIILHETQKVQSSPLADLEAYSVLFGAVGLMHRFSPTDFQKSRQLLTALLEHAPDHPTPLAWMARWHLLRVVQGWSENPGRDSELAYGCTARALDIDPSHALALVSEGQVLTHLQRRLDDAEHRYNAALDINPNDANGRILKAMLLAFTDRGKEGMPDANRGLQLSPLDPHRFMNLALAAGVHLSAGFPDRATELLRESYRLNRTHASTLRMLAVAEVRSGNIDRAKNAASELMKLQPDLRVGDWLNSAPSGDFEVGHSFARDMRRLGIPG